MEKLDYSKGMEEGVKISNNAYDKSYPFRLLKANNLQHLGLEPIYEVVAMFREKEAADDYMNYIRQKKPDKLYKIEDRVSEQKIQKEGLKETVPQKVRGPSSKAPKM